MIDHLIIVMVAVNDDAFAAQNYPEQIRDQNDEMKFDVPCCKALGLCSAYRPS